MQTEFQRLPLLPQPEILTPAAQIRIHRCAKLLAQHFAVGNSLILDADGVVVEQDSLFHPKITDLRLIQSLRRLEQQGVSIGVATARSENFVEFLQSLGLILRGPLILQQGQVLYQNDKKIYFVSEKYREFVATTKKVVRASPIWKSSWIDVWSSNEGIFCDGNSQWQGDCRISYWVYERDEQRQGEQLKQHLDVIVANAGEVFGLRPNIDYVTSFGRMSLERYVQNGTLGIISLKAIRDGVPFDKSIAASYVGKPVVIVSDGYKDGELGHLNKALGGINIGIEGNLDEEINVAAYMEEADICLASPFELSQALGMVVQ